MTSSKIGGFDISLFTLARSREQTVYKLFYSFRKFKIVEGNCMGNGSLIAFFGFLQIN